jgi:hypothetical protein
VIYDSFQREAILDLAKAIEIGEDRLVEKTRDMGASWIVLYVFIWFWLFHDNCDFRIGSRKEDFVDKIGDMDTLMEKVRFTLRFLPSWMKPEGYVESEHATYMRIVNPKNKNTIIGESANPHFGSGGRRKAILLDEYAKWETSVADAAWTSTHDVTRCRIVVSTPVGSAKPTSSTLPWPATTATNATSPRCSSASSSAPSSYGATPATSCCLHSRA